MPFLGLTCLESSPRWRSNGNLRYRCRQGSSWYALLIVGFSDTSLIFNSPDIVLTDDNFASIVNGIREGRIIFDNLKKTIAYTLTHLVPELIPVLCSLAFSMPLALTSLLILTIDLLCELGPAISLAYEKVRLPVVPIVSFFSNSLPQAESDIMTRPPRDAKRDRLVTPQLIIYSYLIMGVIETLAGFWAYFTVFTNKAGIPVNMLPFAQPPYFIDPRTNATIPSFNYTSTITNQPVSLDKDQQWAIYTEATSAFYVVLVMSQFGHIWMVKTRVVSLFTHGIRNLVTIFGTLLQLALIFIVVYVPFLQVRPTSQTPPLSHHISLFFVLSLSSCLTRSIPSFGHHASHLLVPFGSITNLES